MATINSNLPGVSDYLSAAGTVRPRTRRPDDPASPPQEQTTDDITLRNAIAIRKQIAATRGEEALSKPLQGVDPDLLAAIDMRKKTEAERVLQEGGSDDEVYGAAAYLADRSAREAIAAFNAAREVARTATNPHDLASRIVSLHAQHGPDLQRTAQELTLEGWDPRLLTPSLLGEIDRNIEDIKRLASEQPAQASPGAPQPQPMNPEYAQKRIQSFVNLKRQLLSMTGDDLLSPPGDTTARVPVPNQPAGPGSGELTHAVRLMRDALDAGMPQGERGIFMETSAAMMRGMASGSAKLSALIDLAAQALDHPASFAIGVADNFAGTAQRGLKAIGDLAITPADKFGPAGLAGAAADEIRLARKRIRTPAAKDMLQTADESHGDPVSGAILHAFADVGEAQAEAGNLMARPSPSVAAPWGESTNKWKKSISTVTETGTEMVGQVGSGIVAGLIAGPEVGVAVGAGVGTSLDVGGFVRSVYQDQVAQKGASPEDARATAAAAGLAYAPLSTLFNAVPLEAYLAKSPVGAAAKNELVKLAQKYAGEQLTGTAVGALRSAATQAPASVAMQIAQDFDKWAIANDADAFAEWKSRYGQAAIVGGLTGGAIGTLTHLPTSIDAPAVSKIKQAVKDIRQVKPEAEAIAASPHYAPEIPGVAAPTPETAAAIQTRRENNHDTRTRAVMDFADANGLDVTKVRIMPEGSLRREQQRVSDIGAALGVDVFFAHPGSQDAPQTIHPAASAGPGQIVIDARETGRGASTALLSHEIVHEFSARSGRLNQPEAMNALIDAVRAADPEYFDRATAAVRAEIRNNAPKTEAPLSEPHEFSSTHLEVPKQTADSVVALAAKIPDEALAKDGRESKPHITVKYGIHGDDAAAVQALLEGTAPIKVKIGDLSLFKNEDADVVKANVISPALHELNARIAQAVPNTSTHPEYQPHLTIAYVKPGKGDSIIKQIGAGNALSGSELTIDQLVFSDRNGRETVIPLGGSRRPTSEEAVAMAAEVAARYVFNPNLSGEKLYQIATAAPNAITRLLSSAQGVLRKLGIRQGQTDTEILTQRRNTARVAINIRAIAEQLQQTADTLPLGNAKPMAGKGRNPSIRPSVDTNVTETDAPSARGDTAARRAGPPETYAIGDGANDIPLADKPKPSAPAYPVEGDAGIPVEPGLPPGQSTDAAIRPAKQEAVSPGAPARKLGTPQRMAALEDRTYPIGDNPTESTAGDRRVKGEQHITPAAATEPLVKAQVLASVRDRFPEAKADGFTFANRMADPETGTRSQAERIAAMSETPPEGGEEALNVPGARTSFDETRYLAMVNLMEARKQLTQDKTNGMEGARAYKLRVGDRFSIGTSEAEVMDVGADSVTVAVQHPPNELRIGDWFASGDRQEFDLPADMIVPINKDSLLRPEGQSNIGTGIGRGEDARTLPTPRDGIPFATRGRAAAISADVYKAKAAEALTEPAGQQTIGRPDLANPARTEPTRRLVNAADELLKPLDVQKDRDVYAQAEARLAGDRSAAERDLLNRRITGQPIDSIDTVIGQKLVGEAMEQVLKTGSVEAYTRALNIADAYRQTGTDAARAFRLRRDPNESPADRNRRFLGEVLTTPDSLTAKQLEKANARVRSAESPAAKAAAQADVQALIARQAQKLDKTLDALRRQGIEPSTISQQDLANPVIAAKIARIISASNGTTWEKASEYWINAILSGTGTHAANLIGNTASVGWETFIQRGIEGAIADGARLAGLDPGNSATLSEYSAMARAIQPALARAARNFLLGFNTELSVLERQVSGDIGASSGTGGFAEHGAKIGGTTGRNVRTPTRLLTASDEFFKGLAGTLDAHAQAYRIAQKEGLTGAPLWERVAALTNDMSSPAWAEALKTAERQTFQNENAATKLGGGVRNLLNAGAKNIAGEVNLSGVDVPVGTFVLPFVKTPTNIALRAAEKTPLVTFQSVARLLSGSYKQDHSLIIRDAANHVVAYGLTALLWGMVRPGTGQPIITGATPSDRGERDLENRTAPPLSIRVGDTWYSYARIEPFATAVGSIVDTIQRAKTDGIAAAIVDSHKTILEQIKDKTFVQGLGDIVRMAESLQKPGSHALTDWASNFAVSWEPNILRQAMRSTDPMERDRRIRPSDNEGLLAAAVKRTGQAMLPIASVAPPPKVDLWGREVSAKSLDSPATDIPYRMLVPVKQKPADQVSALDRLIVAYNAKVPDDQRFFPTLPSATVTRHVQGKPTSFRLSDQEYHDMLVFAGQTAAARLAGLAQYADNPGPGAIDTIKKELSQAHHEAADYILRRRSSTFSSK